MSKNYKTEYTRSPYHAITKEDINQRKLFILDFSDSRESENSKINEQEDLNYKYKAFSVNRFTFPKSPEKYTNYSDYKNNLEEARINLKNAFFSNETFQENNLNVFSNRNGNYTQIFFPETHHGKIKKQLYHYLKSNNLKNKRYNDKLKEKDKIEELNEQKGEEDKNKNKEQTEISKENKENNEIETIDKNINKNTEKEILEEKLKNKIDKNNIIEISNDNKNEIDNNKNLNTEFSGINADNISNILPVNENINNLNNE